MLAVQLPVLVWFTGDGIMAWAKGRMRTVIKLEDPVARADRLIFIVQLGTLAAPPFGATIVRRDLEHMAMEVFEYAAGWHGQELS